MKNVLWFSIIIFLFGLVFSNISLSSYIFEDYQMGYMFIQLSNICCALSFAICLGYLIWDFIRNKKSKTKKEVDSIDNKFLDDVCLYAESKGFNPMIQFQQDEYLIGQVWLCDVKDNGERKNIIKLNPPDPKIKYNSPEYKTLLGEVQTQIDLLK